MSLCLFIIFPLLPSATSFFLCLVAAFSSNWIFLLPLPVRWSLAWSWELNYQISPLGNVIWAICMIECENAHGCTVAPTGMTPFLLDFPVAWCCPLTPLLLLQPERLGTKVGRPPLRATCVRGHNILVKKQAQTLTALAHPYYSTH